MPFSGRTNNTLKYIRKWEYILPAPSWESLCVVLMRECFFKSIFGAYTAFLPKISSHCASREVLCAWDTGTAQLLPSHPSPPPDVCNCSLLLFSLQTGLCHPGPGGGRGWDTFGWSERQLPAAPRVRIHHQPAGWKVSPASVILHALGWCSQGHLPTCVHVQNFHRHHSSQCGLRMASGLLLWEHTWLELSVVKGPKRKEKEKNPELQQNYTDIQTPGVKMCQVCWISTFLTLEYFHRSGFPGNSLSSHLVVVVVKCESSM